MYRPSDFSQTLKWKVEFELKHELLSLAVEVVRTMFFGVEQTLYYNVTKYYVPTDMKLYSFIYVYILLYFFIYLIRSRDTGSQSQLVVLRMNLCNDIIANRLTLCFVS